MYNKCNPHSWTMIDELWKYKKEVYLCFIDCTEAFDRAQHDEIIRQLTQLKIDGKDLWVIRNIYWEQTAAMWDDGEIRSIKKTKLYVTQECMLSSDLFSPYSEIIMQNLEGCPRIKVGGHNLYHMRYAADTVPIRHLWKRKKKEIVWNEEQKDRSSDGQSQQCASTHQHLYWSKWTQVKVSIQILGYFNIKWFNINWQSGLNLMLTYAFK